MICSWNIFQNSGWQGINHSGINTKHIYLEEVRPILSSVLAHPFVSWKGTVGLLDKQACKKIILNLKYYKCIHLLNLRFWLTGFHSHTMPSKALDVIQVKIPIKNCACHLGAGDGRCTPLSSGMPLSN